MQPTRTNVSASMRRKSDSFGIVGLFVNDLTFLTISKRPTEKGESQKGPKVEAFIV